MGRIRGYRLKFLNAELYWNRLEFDYYRMLINNVIGVDDGIEKVIGMLTGYPTVEAVIGLIEIVGPTKLAWLAAFITVIVIGRMFRK